MIVDAIAIILDHADADLDGCRKRFGPQLVDLVVSSRNRFLTKQGGRGRAMTMTRPSKPPIKATYFPARLASHHRGRRR